MTRNFIVENIEDAVIAVDIENRVLDLNPAMQKLLAISREVVGESITVAFKNYPAVFEPYLSVMTAHDEISFPISDSLPSLRYFDLRVIPMERDNQFTGRLFIFHDITKRRETEVRLRQSELVRTLVEVAADAIISINAEGIVAAFNTTASRMFGYAPEEVIGQNIKVLIPEPTSLKHDDYIRRRKSTGETKIIGALREEFAMRRDGSVFPIYLAINEVNVGGQLMFTGLIRDLTETKQIERERDRLFEQTQKALAEARAYAQQLDLLNEMSQHVNMASTEQDIFRIVTQYITHILTTDQITITLATDDPDFLEVAVHEGGEKVVEVGQRLPINAMATREAIRERRALNIANLGALEGRYIPAATQQGLQSSLLAPMVAHQNLVGTVGISSKKMAAYNEKDETLLLHIASFLGIAIENTRRTHELQDAMQLADQANRAKSEFLATMSHELRTPLNGILGYVQILNKNSELTPKQRDGLTIIRNSGEHLLTLINDILDLSKIEAQRMELEEDGFSLKEMLESICAIIQVRAAQKNLTFRYEPLSELPVAVYGDEMRLRQVLLNLLGNAVKFTEQGGILLKVGYHNANIRFQVEDSGIGIAPEALRLIFQPFQQADKRGAKVEGTGLGLAISNQLVNLMGGQIQVDSRAGAGSKFWFELQLTPIKDWVDKPKVEERNVTGYRGGPYRVMVVDDRWENRSVLTNMLLPLGFEIEEAVNGQDCLNKATSFQPHAILMDLRMPIMDGLAAIRHLRATPPSKDVVIISVSASAFDYDREESLEAGSNDFLAKPFRFNQLIELLNTYLQIEWVYENDPPPKDMSETAHRIIAPPAADLAVLLDLAKRGNVRALSEQADRLVQAGYIGFATTLQMLTRNFKLKEIRDFIQQHEAQAQE